MRDELSMRHKQQILSGPVIKTKLPGQEISVTEFRRRKERLTNGGRNVLPNFAPGIRVEVDITVRTSPPARTSAL